MSHEYDPNGDSWAAAFRNADLNREYDPRRANPTVPAHPAVEAFWKQLMEEAPHEDWSRGVDALLDDVTVNLEQSAHWDPPEVWVEMIESRARGQGKATRAMRWLTSLADRHGVMLLLVPDSQEDPSGAGPHGESALSTAALEAWYGRLGFVPEEGTRFGGGTGVMVRKPRTPNPLRLSGRMKEIPLDEDLREDLSSVLRIHAHPPTPGMLAFWKEYREGTRELAKGSGWAHSLHDNAVILDLRMDSTQRAIHIVEIKAVDKGTGAGNRAMQFLTRLADRHDVTLTLVAQRLGKDGMKQGDLVRWYRRHGFQRRGTRGWDMRRKPR
jgi:hypothetical protein